MKYRMSALISVAAAVLLTACASETPYYDATFGRATEQVKATQAVQGTRSANAMQMDARALHNGMINYMGDRPAPQAIQGVISGSRGTSGQ